MIQVRNRLNKFDPRDRENPQLQYIIRIKRSKNISKSVNYDKVPDMNEERN